jgi:hypothetical protein
MVCQRSNAESPKWQKFNLHMGISLLLKGTIATFWVKQLLAIFWGAFST